MSEKQRGVERKMTLVTRVMQITMIVALIVGWILMRFVRIDNEIILIGFFVLFAFSLAVTALIKRRIKMNAPDSEDEEESES